MAPKHLPPPVEMVVATGDVWLRWFRRLRRLQGGGLPLPSPLSGLLRTARPAPRPIRLREARQSRSTGAASRYGAPRSAVGSDKASHVPPPNQWRLRPGPCQEQQPLTPFGRVALSKVRAICHDGSIAGESARRLRHRRVVFALEERHRRRIRWRNRQTVVLIRGIRSRRN